MCHSTEPRSVLNYKTSWRTDRYGDTERNFCMMQVEEETVQTNSVTPYSCDKCGATYDSLANYKVHLESKHKIFSSETFSEDYPNSIGTLLAETSEIEEDNQAHPNRSSTNKTTELFVCKLCSKNFNRKVNLQNHSRIHDTTKRYKCKMCSTSFVQYSSWRRHMLNHVGKKPHKCDLCNSSFSQKSNLKIHMMTHTGEKPYKCGLCVKSYNRKSRLIEHQSTHSAEYRYKCDVCTSSFTRKSNLNAHTKIHTTENPYIIPAIESSV